MTKIIKFEPKINGQNIVFISKFVYWNFIFLKLSPHYH